MFYTDMGYLYWVLVLQSESFPPVFPVTNIYSSYSSPVLVIPDFIRRQSELYLTHKPADLCFGIVFEDI